jgi:HSP20 family protein
LKLDHFSKTLSQNQEANKLATTATAPNPHKKAVNQSTTMALQPFGHPFFSSGFDDFFDPRPFRHELMPVLANLERANDQILMRASPGYEIHEDDEKYSIAIDVPGVKSEDMTIKFEESGRVLNLSGGRKIKKGDTVSETKFVKRFTIGDNVDVDNIAANLSDGVLEVTAPKKAPEKKEAHIIKITEGPAPSKLF